MQPNTFKKEQSIIDFTLVLNQANQQINAQGKTILYHNHDFEFQNLKGEYINPAKPNKALGFGKMVYKKTD